MLSRGTNMNMDRVTELTEVKGARKYLRRTVPPPGDARPYLFGGVLSAPKLQRLFD